MIVVDLQILSGAAGRTLGPFGTLNPQDLRNRCSVRERGPARPATREAESTAAALAGESVCREPVVAAEAPSLIWTALVTHPTDHGLSSSAPEEP